MTRGGWGPERGHTGLLRLGQRGHDLVERQLDVAVNDPQLQLGTHTMGKAEAGRG